MSSNINEVIRAVSNFFLFYEKISRAQKLKKPKKAQKSTKSSKRHKDAQAKAQNANKSISDCFPPRCFSVRL